MGGYRSSIHRILAAFANLSASSTNLKVGGLQQGAMGQMVFHSDIWLKKDLGTGSGLPQFLVLQKTHNLIGGPPKKVNYVFILGLKIGVNFHAGADLSSCRVLEELTLRIQVLRLDRSRMLKEVRKVSDSFNSTISTQ